MGPESRSAATATNPPNPSRRRLAARVDALEQRATLAAPPHHQQSSGGLGQSHSIQQQPAHFANGTKIKFSVVGGPPRVESKSEAIPKPPCLVCVHALSIYLPIGFRPLNILSVVCVLSQPAIKCQFITAANDMAV